eukprot:maker-scaffold109_size355148-snap-gene-2.23 protein:Tk11037 transcript:maker-scaffold109_size355148-snap-gene-2.23-mRNA-1 annotation:"PREDICTED: uncharacterized protein LOC100906847"
MASNRQFFLGLMVVAVAIVFPCTTGLGCYVCQSVNGDNPYCEDPFNTTHPNSTDDFFRTDCRSGRKHRNGKATACVKVRGTYWHSGETLVIRTCTVDSNTLTTDPEIARVEHSCGLFDFVGNASEDPSQVKRLSGCI